MRLYQDRQAASFQCTVFLLAVVVYSVCVSDCAFLCLRPVAPSEFA